MGIILLLFLAVSLGSCFPDAVEGPLQKISNLSQHPVSNVTDIVKDYFPVVAFSDMGIYKNFPADPFPNKLVRASFPFTLSHIELNDNSPITGDIKILSTGLIVPGVTNDNVESGQMGNVRRQVSSCHLYNLLFSFNKRLTSMGTVQAILFVPTRCLAVQLTLHVWGTTCVALNCNNVSALCKIHTNLRLLNLTVPDTPSALEKSSAVQWMLLV